METYLKIRMVKKKSRKDTHRKVFVFKKKNLKLKRSLKTKIKPGPKNLRMGKQLIMIEGIIVTDSFWS